MRIESMKLEVALGSNNKEGQALTRDIKSREVELASVHDIGGLVRGSKYPGHIVYFSIGNLDERRG